MKEVQSLVRNITALFQFIFKAADKTAPLFSYIRKAENFQWTQECKEAFQQVKKFLATLPILTKPEPGEDLLLYLSISNWAISLVLVKNERCEQRPIYFTSKVLQGVETRYQKIEKVALAVVTIARRLRPYFQGHQIIVKTDQPIKQILSKPNLVGRMIAWSIELSEYDIIYQVRGLIKSQFLSNFIVEWCNAKPQIDKSWVLFLDSSSNLKGSGSGIILEGPEGIMIE